MSSHPPTFLRRPRRTNNMSQSEDQVRDVLANLRQSADLDVTEVLASGLNTFIAAMIRLRGNDVFHSPDIVSLLNLWEILLNTAKAVPDYTGGKGHDIISQFTKQENQE